MSGPVCLVVLDGWEDERRNYVKRCVGLPGDAIQLFEGDLYIDGDLFRKSGTALDALLFEVFSIDRVWSEALEDADDDRTAAAEFLMEEQLDLWTSVSGQWQVLRNWRLSGSYTYAKTLLHPFPGNTIDSDLFNSAGQLEAELEPNHIFSVRSYLNLPHNLELDTFYYYVDSRNSPTPQSTFQSIPEYGRLDVRLGWQPMKNVDLSFVAQNLLDGQHPELSELVEVSSETQRSYYLKATLKF